MLDLKEVDYELVSVLALNQRLHVRLAGFRGGTVPALRVDGRRIQGSRQIARAADQLWPDPPLSQRIRRSGRGSRKPSSGASGTCSPFPGASLDSAPPTI